MMKHSRAVATLTALNPHPEKRPVYLDPRTNARVRLEGPSLTVDADGRAERYLPLRRISRILTSDRVEFTTEALLACAERGITLVFVSRHGEVRARVLGAPGERQELRQRLLDFLSRPDWQELYGTWVYAVEKQTVIRVGRRLRAPEGMANARALRAWIGRVARDGSDPETAANSRNWLEELGFSWMLNHLQQLGLGAQSELLQDGHPDLTADFTRIFAWELEPIRLGWLRRRRIWAHRRGTPLRPARRSEVVKLYERNGARLGRAGRGLTNRFHRWLVELT